MIDISTWMNEFLHTLTVNFGERVWFVGLQGSYGREEATETSDIDVVVILDEVSAPDIQTYNRMLDTLSHRELICGFLSGKKELLNWEPSDLFQFYYDTKPIKGSLDELLSLIDDEAVNRAIKIGACNIYHGCVHNMLYEKSEEILKGLYKSASFIAQAICFKQIGNYICHQKDLLDIVSPEERVIVDTFLALKNGGQVEFQEMSETLFAWAKKWIEKEKELQVPSKIKSLIDNKAFTVDNIGMSGNHVWIFDDMVLKIGDDSTSMIEQVQMIKWLEGKLPVPQVLAYEEAGGKSYLRMSKMCGEMSCDTYYLEHPNELLEALACGLNMLWEVDVRDCPRIRDLDAVLKEARMNVENNFVDLDNVDPATFGEGGFKSPKHLLEWLENNRPTFEPVFSHGDYCLPNIFLEKGEIKGFIDLDRAGVSDKWNDIALCYRSLKHNFDGTYGGKVYEDFNPDLLFEKLGMEPDWDKLNYYILLDELF